MSVWSRLRSGSCRLMAFSLAGHAPLEISHLTRNLFCAICAPSVRVAELLLAQITALTRTLESGCPDLNREPRRPERSPSEFPRCRSHRHDSRARRSTVRNRRFLATARYRRIPLFGFVPRHFRANSRSREITICAIPRSHLPIGRPQLSVTGSRLREAAVKGGRRAAERTLDGRVRNPPEVQQWLWLGALRPA